MTKSQLHSFLGSSLLAIIIALSFFAILLIFKCFYSLCFHPLAKYPGPRGAALSDLWWTNSIKTGRHPLRMIELHEKYGDVVRIAPNHLSFCTIEAYLDVYTRTTKEKKAFLKFAKYERPGDFSTVRDPEIHARHKKALSKGFSIGALRDQEIIIQQYLGLLGQQLRKFGKDGKEPVDVGQTLKWFTLDIIGDLAFGESFNALAKGSNHMVELIQDTLRYNQEEYVRRERPWLGPIIARLMFPRSLKAKHQEYITQSLASSTKRIGRGDLDRQDFFSHLIRDDRITEGELTTSAWVLIMAGSETTATSVTAAVFFLLQNPNALNKLATEVRSAFHYPEDITGDATGQLDYLNAVIEEVLRLFPPIALGLPRESPGTTVDGHWVGEGVCVSVEAFALGYDDRYWIKPKSFLPERWLNEEFAEENKLAHHPFSEGPRACLGKNLAYLEFRLALARLAWEFDWDLVSNDIEDWVEAAKCYAFWTLPKLLVTFKPRSEQ